MVDVLRGQKISALPEEIFDELFRDDELELRQDLAKKNGLKRNQEDKLGETIRDLFLKDISIEDLAAEISKRLGVGEDTGRRVALEIANTRLLPHQNYFGDVKRQIIVWGGDPATAMAINAPPISPASDAPKGREAKASASVVAPTAKVAPDAPKSSFEKRAAAESEVEITKNKKEAGGIAASIESLDEALGTKIKSIMAQSNLNFTDSSLQKRLETIISARIRDVRDASETKEMLMRGDKVGGLGLNTDAAQRVMDLLSSATGELHGAYKKEEEAKRQQFLRKQAEKEALQRSDRERREKEEREKLYARVTGVGPTVKKLEVRSPLLAGVAKLPAPGSRLQTSRPKMEEVKFVPKVTGPVDELRTMSLEQFHRLSKDPRQAIEKIKDRIELLANEDYSKQIAGVRAWQESGVNKLYLELLKESLGKGVPVSAVIEEKSKGGAEALTKEEFDAIMELNGSLRF